MNSILLSFDADPGAARLAHALSLPALAIARHRFPDGEVKLTLPATLTEHAIVYRGLEQPNDKLIELLLAARTARQLGARRLTLVAPYLAYMRQDMAFAPGEAVSQSIVGAFLADLFDAVITVDPHLHRTDTLAQAVPTGQAIALSAAQAIGRYLAGRHTDLVLVGPDAEAEQWVARAAEAAACPHLVCHKERHGDREVEIEFEAADLHGKHCVIVDDVASTGRTVAACARLLLARGARRVDVAVTHALFVGDALDVLSAAGVSEVISTDAIAHPSNRIALAPMLAQAVRSLHD